MLTISDLLSMYFEINRQQYKKKRAQVCPTGNCPKFQVLGLTNYSLVRQPK